MFEKTQANIFPKARKSWVGDCKLFLDTGNFLEFSFSQSHSKIDEEAYQSFSDIAMILIAILHCVTIWGNTIKKIANFF